MGTPMVKIFKGKFLHYFETASGWEFVSRKREPYADGNTETDAVVIVPIYMDKDIVKLIITSEWREPMQKWVFGFPAGLVDDGETVEETAIRELKEETGLDAMVVLTTSPQLWSSEGLTDECVQTVFVLCAGEVSDSFLVDSEKIKTFMLEKHEMEEMFDRLDEPSEKASFGKVAYYVMKDFANTGFSKLLSNALKG